MSYYTKLKRTVLLTCEMNNQQSETMIIDHPIFHDARLEYFSWMLLSLIARSVSLGHPS